jgi:hypothetical protein
MCDQRREYFENYDALWRARHRQIVLVQRLCANLDSTKIKQELSFLIYWKLALVMRCAKLFAHIWFMFRMVIFAQVCELLCIVDARDEFSNPTSIAWLYLCKLMYNCCDLHVNTYCANSYREMCFLFSIESWQIAARFWRIAAGL